MTQLRGMRHCKLMLCVMVPDCLVGAAMSNTTSWQRRGGCWLKDSAPAQTDATAGSLIIQAQHANIIPLPFTC
jgi:hypothetical protein